MAAGRTPAPLPFHMRLSLPLQVENLSLQYSAVSAVEAVMIAKLLKSNTCTRYVGGTLHVSIRLVSFTGCSADLLFVDKLYPLCTLDLLSNSVHPKYICRWASFRGNRSLGALGLAAIAECLRFNAGLTFLGGASHVPENLEHYYYTQSIVLRSRFWMVLVYVPNRVFLFGK